VSANVNALTAASALPRVGFVAVRCGAPPAPRRHAIPTAATPRNTRSSRLGRSFRSHGASSRMKTGLESWRKTALAAVVSLFACTNRIVVIA